LYLDDTVSPWVKPLCDAGLLVVGNTMTRANHYAGGTVLVCIVTNEFPGSDLESRTDVDAVHATCKRNNSSLIFLETVPFSQAEQATLEGGDSIVTEARLLNSYNLQYATDCTTMWDKICTHAIAGFKNECSLVEITVDAECLDRGVFLNIPPDAANRQMLLSNALALVDINLDADLPMKDVVGASPTKLDIKSISKSLLLLKFNTLLLIRGEVFGPAVKYTELN